MSSVAITQPTEAMMRTLAAITLLYVRSRASASTPRAVNCCAARLALATTRGEWAGTERGGRRGRPCPCCCFEGSPCPMEPSRGTTLEVGRSCGTECPRNGGPPVGGVPTSGDPSPLLRLPLGSPLPAAALSTHGGGPRVNRAASFRASAATRSPANPARSRCSSWWSYGRESCTITDLAEREAMAAGAQMYRI
jgi:hypothetical protein